MGVRKYYGEGISTTYSYTYDNNGNITEISDSNGYVTRYFYDNLGQLTREDNPYLGKTYSYSYDFAGNLLRKTTYAYSTESSYGTATSTQTYTYSTGAWGDQLSGTTYDAIGNPLTYNSYTMEWNGRQLMEMNMAAGQFVLTFTYNADGIRTSKKVGSTEHIYTLNGSQIVSETIGNILLVYLYDESGAPIGLQYRTSSYEAGQFDTYYFEKNWQGDILAVYTEAGVKIGSYTYDAWGNCTATVVSSATTLQKSIVRTRNPFRYRGYYYDTETQLYYLQSRYYNPATGRFINADGYVNANGDLIGFNMYAYCSNNPVVYIDTDGNAKVAVLYDSRTSGIFWGHINGEGFERQGTIIVNQLLEDGHDVTAVPFTDIEEFIAGWNNLETTYDELYIIAHGYIGSLDCNKQRLLPYSSPEKNIFSFSSLDRKTINGIVYLYCCNGATEDRLNNSTALIIANITQAPVYAVKNGKLNIAWKDARLAPAGNGKWCYTYPSAPKTHPGGGLSARMYCRD